MYSTCQPLVVVVDLAGWSRIETNDDTLDLDVSASTEKSQSMSNTVCRQSFVKDDQYLSLAMISCETI